MKKILFLTAALCLLAISAFAQNKTDFSGNWELNTIESRMDERMRIESMTLKVNQTDKDITVGTFTKRTISNEGGGTNRGGQGGVTPQALTYSLSEGTGTRGGFTGGSVSQSGSGTTTLKASMESDGKLKLSQTRVINTDAGELTITVNETWELAGGGETLRISRTTESPRGNSSSELVFTKKAADDNPAIANTETTGGMSTPKMLSGGVLNGKATKLVKPAYPEAAKVVKAGGAVNVQVTIDEAGNIISASAVSGHPLLRAASEEAARASTFSPTLLQGVPVKVTGIIVYNFTP
jgi:TonB family protein